jgi:uncharacterized protein
MIKQTIDQDIKAAMLAGDKRLTTTLRGLKSAILSVEIETGKRDQGLNDQEAIGVLQKEVKKRIEAADLYEQSGNIEQANEERFEQDAIQKYLPKQLTEGEIDALIDEAIAEFKIELNNQAMGKLIAAVKDKSGGAADGATVAKLVKVRLN